jgi:gliding motility-associated protein GldL
MTITDIVESKGYKKLMAKIYGWGAAVVILGALFKIQHYPGASYMLVAGLGTEAIIFFFSAFEPLHEELDWTLVYPELAGMTEDMDEELEMETGSGKAIDDAKRGIVSGGGGGGGSAAMARFDELLEEGNIGKEIFDKLGEGLNKFSDTVTNINDLSSASLATEEYVKSVQTASGSMGELNETYNKTSEALSASAQNLSASYNNTAEAISQSGTDVAGLFNKAGEEMAEAISKSSQSLNESYLSLTESISANLETVKEGSTAYSEKLVGVNKNLSELNSLYELQLKNTNEQLKSTEDLYSGIGNMMQNLNESVEETKKYKEEVSKLSQNLEALNDIYGNMLSAMNFNK